MWIILIFFLIHWYASIFMQTFFLHRYAAHRMFTTSKFWEKVFYIVTYISQGSSYLSAYAYGVLHRMHHAYTDTDKDPHSPSYTKTALQMMWETKNIYTRILERRYPVEERFTRDLPDWPLMDRIASSWISRIMWGVFYVLFYIAFAEHWALFLLLPIHFTMGPVHGVIINWFSHKYGYRNFKVENTSTNYLPFDFLTMGEGYHNNHHRYGTKPNFGFKWFELDLTYVLMKIMNAFRVIRLNPA